MTPNYLPGAEIRRQFLDFFAQNGHTIVRSAPLIPADATLMFTNSGMVQFKDVFSGAEKRDYSRATTCQKCLRISGKHNDLEEVGRTPRHQTMFEMLGNFSFGDYFKEEAIRYSWKLLTEIWKLDVSKLWVTVHYTDDEAFDIWTKAVGVPEHRVQRLGDKDNFWSMGPVGPCGPCTEIHVDLGPTMGPEHPQGPAGGGNRYMEIWNNVFMQYYRHPDGTLDPLPRPSVDTGMGLERIASVIQGVTSNYETDLFLGLMNDGAEIAGKKLGVSEDTDTALRVLADHARACAFLVAEGIIPANLGRGYELRRVARRAARFGVMLGLDTEPFFYKLTDRVVERMSDAYPELAERRAFIQRVIRGEEEKFAVTRDKGLALLGTELQGTTTLSGDVVFRLHDTFGFPPDLTRLIAEEKGVGIDEAGYEERMNAQKAAGRAAWKGTGHEGVEEVYRELVDEKIGTEFTGYTVLNGQSEVLALISGGQRVGVLTGEGELVVAKTPFYAESGGQSGDVGTITVAGASFTVTDTQSPLPGLVVHRGHTTGSLTLGDDASLAVDPRTRGSSRRNHTATHLLHAALRTVLGDHVMQKGSLVGPNRLRFDFSHFTAMTKDELRQVEDLVYEQILSDVHVDTRVLPISEAKAEGAIAFFGEKYGDVVRVVRVPGFSMEFCGGTHAGSTGEIGLFRILSEAGISSGVRRIEAQTGLGAMEYIRDVVGASEAAAAVLRARPAELADAITKMQLENRALRKEIDDAKRASALSDADALLSKARDVNGVKVLAARSEVDRDAMREQADKLRDKLGSGVVVLGAVHDGKVAFLVAVTKDLAGSRVHAGKLAGALAEKVGGKGGGRPDFAQAGGSDVAGLDAAIEAAYTLV